MASELATYISEQYRKYKDNRQTTDEKWQRNIDAFRSISTDVWKAGEGEDWRSSTFCDYTRQKCLAGYALIIDMILSGGKLPFMLKLSPWSGIEYDLQEPEVKKAVDDQIEQMTKLIELQLSDTRIDRNTMRSIMSGAIYGEGFLKKIVYSKSRRQYDPADDGSWTETVIDKMQPGFNHISVWDVFRDLESEDLRESAGIIHRQMISSYWLRQRIGQPLYVDDEITACLEEFASTTLSTDDSTIQPSQRDLSHRKNEKEYLEFWGRVPRRIIDSHLENTDLSPLAFADLDNGDEVEIMACVCGDRVVRFSLSDPEERPFYRFVWEMALDEIGANGVADNVEPFQKIINGIVRNMEDNLRLASNVMLAVKERWIDDAQISFRPGARIPIADECDDVRKAIQPLVIPDVTAGLSNFMTLIERVLDEASGIPKIAQGQTPVGNRTGTATEINQQLEKSGKGIASVIRNFDEGIIEPIIEDTYRYNMMDPECQCKGNYIVQALGFTSYQARVERVAKLMQFLNLVSANPALFQLTKVRDLLMEISKALDVDPDQVLKSAEELDAESQQANPVAELDLAERQANVQAKQAETQQRRAGILFDKKKLEMEQARINQAVAGAFPNSPIDLGSEGRSTVQGPYMERGMDSNNLQGVPIGV